MVSLLGIKLGMTRVFNEVGSSFAVTVIHAGPCVVLGRKVFEDKAYSSVLLGYLEDKRRVNKAQASFFSKLEVSPKKYLREVKMDLDESALQVLSELNVDVFSPGDKVDVQGFTKGRGFQGVVKRYGFHRGPMSHGSRHHRSPGSIGSCADPGRVFKGKKLPGRMGGKKTVQNLEIITVDRLVNVLLVRGAVPGYNGQLVCVSSTSKSRKKVVNNG